MKRINVIYIFYLLLFIILIILIISAIMKDYIDEKTDKYNLEKDGFVVIKDAVTLDEIKILKNYCNNNNYRTAKSFLINNNNLKNIIHKETKNINYIFQDYIWIIKKSSVHTCHRDNNGDFFNKGQKYPSYTMLIYLEDMDKCLGVIKSSHKNINSNNINFSNNVINIPCKKGDIILFNANLIHVGALNKRDDNLRIQMKVTHKDDIKHIYYYQNFNKVLNKDNKLPFIIKKIQKNTSCMFPIISNLTQNENIRSSRGTDNGVEIGFFQKIFSYIFYGNSQFYDLPNAF